MITTQTSRISIDVTPEQHKRLKAIAALSGQSLKDYVLERSLPQDEGDTALAELEALLAPRVESARSGQFADASVESIFDGVARQPISQMPAYRITPEARDDLRDIARYTLDTWGAQQHSRYRDLFF